MVKTFVVFLFFFCLNNVMFVKQLHSTALFCTVKCLLAVFPFQEKPVGKTGSCQLLQLCTVTRFLQTLLTLLLCVHFLKFQIFILKMSMITVLCECTIPSSITSHVYRFSQNFYIYVSWSTNNKFLWCADIISKLNRLITVFGYTHTYVLVYIYINLILQCFPKRM